MEGTSSQVKTSSYEADPKVYWNILHDISIEKFSTSSMDQQYLLIYGDRNFQVNQAVKLEIEKQRQVYQDALATRSVVPAPPEGWVSKELLPRLLEGASPEPPFSLNKDLFSADAISPLTNLLSRMFSDKAIMLGLTALTAFAAGLMLTGLPPFRFSPTIDELIIIYALLLLSAVFHELGHAAACRRFGVEHGKIGIGLYLYFPVFYADVSRSWAVPRKERLIIDCGGMYLQLQFTFCLFLIHHLLTPIPGFDIYLALTLLSILFNLNPFLKFDGYWIASDLLGVPNLRARTWTLLRYLLWERGQPPSTHNSTRAFLQFLRPREKRFFVVYALLVCLVFSYFVFFRLPPVFIDILMSYHLEIANFISNLADAFRRARPFDWGIAKRLFFHTFFLVITLRILWKGGAIGLRYWKEKKGGFEMPAKVN